MADRKASVDLELKAGQFKAEATVVENKVRTLDDAVEDLDRDITKIPPDAAKAGAALKLLDGNVENLGRSVNDLGEKNTGLAVLDAKIREAQKDVRKLADEFVKTGDVDVFRRLGEAEGKLRGLRDARKSVADLGNEVKNLDREITKIPADAAKADAALKLLVDDVSRAGQNVDNLGKKGSGLAVLDSKIRETQREVNKLADEFTKTGDIDIFRKLGDAESRLRGLKDVRKKLAEAVVPEPAEVDGFFKRLASRAEEWGNKIGSMLPAGISGALANPIVGPIIGAGLIAALTAAASFVGGAIGGAALFGLAAGGVGLGLVGAWLGDPVKYGAQWNVMLDGLQRRWRASSEQFAGPLEASLQEVDRVLRDLPVERIATATAAFALPLVQGAGGGITNFAAGLADALERVKPVVDYVAPKLSNLGRDLGDTFRAISLGSEGGAHALGDLIDLIGWLARATGVLILGFENTYESIRKFLSGVNDAIHTVPLAGKVVDGLGDSLFHVESSSMVAGRALDDVGDKASNATRGVAELTLAIDQLREKEMAMADANIALAQGWLDLKKELEDGKRTLDLNTQAGIDNAKGILTQVENAERLRKQQYELTGDLDASNKAYDANIERIRQQAYALGFNKDQVDRLISSITGLDKTNANPTITVEGLAQAISGTGALARTLAGLDGKSYDTYVKTHYVNDRAGQSRDSGRAAGGPVMAGQAYVVGEHRPEVFVPNVAGTIVPSISQFASRFANLRGAGSIPSMAQAGMPREITLNATFVGPDGAYIRTEVLRFASNRGQSVGTYLGVGTG